MLLAYETAIRHYFVSGPHKTNPLSAAELALPKIGIDTLR